MTITQEQIDIFEPIMSELYDHIVLSDAPPDAPFSSFLRDSGIRFWLDTHGYQKAYLRLLHETSILPNIGEKWSEARLDELGGQFIVRFAEHKANNESRPDFKELTTDWLAKIDIEFEEQLCYGVVAGLSVGSALEIGDVTFLPLDLDRLELKEETAFSIRCKAFDPNSNCLSCSKVIAEWRRATEIHRSQTQNALNVMRYIGSLIWQKQPPHHIYIAGQDPKSLSDFLAVSSKTGLPSSLGTSVYLPLPFRVDSKILGHANFWGLEELQALLRSNNLNELQRSFLTAVQWYGEATQNLIPLMAFVMYYVSIEAATKQKSENAKSVLPQRLSVLIEPGDKTRQRALEKRLGDVIDERNAVLHGGLPQNSDPEVLAWEARNLARQILHQLQQVMKIYNLASKDDLKRWVEARFIK